MEADLYCAFIDVHYTQGAQLETYVKQSCGRVDNVTNTNSLLTDFG